MRASVCTRIPAPDTYPSQRLSSYEFFFIAVYEIEDARYATSRRLRLYSTRSVLAFAMSKFERIAHGERSGDRIDPSRPSLPGFNRAPKLFRIAITTEARARCLVDPILLEIGSGRGRGGIVSWKSGPIRARGTGERDDASTSMRMQGRGAINMDDARLPVQFRVSTTTTTTTSTSSYPITDVFVEARC